MIIIFYKNARYLFVNNEPLEAKLAFIITKPFLPMSAGV